MSEEVAEAEMSNEPQFGTEGLYAQTYESARARYGEIGVGFEEFANGLRLIIERQACEQSGRGLIRDLYTDDIYLTLGCALPTDAAWKEFIRSYKSLIRDIAYYVCRTKQGVADIAMDVIADLYMRDRSGKSRIASYNGSYSLSTWLRTIVANKIFNEQQSRWSKVERLSSIEDRIDPAQYSSLDLDVRTNTYAPIVLDVLRGVCVEVQNPDCLLLLMRFDEQMTISDIARLQQVHSSTISRRLRQVQRRISDRVLSALSGRYNLSSTAIGECVSEILENPACCVISYLKEALELHECALVRSPNGSGNIESSEKEATRPPRVREAIASD